MDNLEKLAVQLWAVGDEVRLRTLRQLPLNEDCKQRNNVTELAEALGIPQPTVSHHLRVLRQAGIIRRSKLCRDCYYHLDPAAIEQMTGNLRDAVLGNER
ncbi:MAG TPA: metalloregulator ArsR/SmtB family transcription factor [Opitutales bacterium]|nr:metalloregulator ArsR/SmtB family transcription factor [Opitutales bacterium]